MLAAAAKRVAARAVGARTGSCDELRRGCCWNSSGPGCYMCLDPPKVSELHIMNDWPGAFISMMTVRVAQPPSHTRTIYLRAHGWPVPFMPMAKLKIKGYWGKIFSRGVLGQYI